MKSACSKLGPTQSINALETDQLDLRVEGPSVDGGRGSDHSQHDQLPGSTLVAKGNNSLFVVAKQNLEKKYNVNFIVMIIILKILFV